MKVCFVHDLAIHAKHHDRLQGARFRDRKYLENKKFFACGKKSVSPQVNTILTESHSLPLLPMSRVHLDHWKRGMNAECAGVLLIHRRAISLPSSNVTCSLKTWEQEADGLAELRGDRDMNQLI